MKIREQVRFEDDTLILKQTHDAGPALREARLLRDAEKTRFGKGGVHVASIPARMFYEWAKEAGVSPSDHEAMQEIVARKLNDPAYLHFRVWEGRF
jgi:hypothetical protein